MLKFSDVPGNHSVKANLVTYAQNGPSSNTLMFSGVEGGSSLPMAFAFANFLVCNNPTSTDSCGECNACRQFIHQNYPDLHLTFPIIKSGKEGSCQHFRSLFLDSIRDNPFLINERWRNELGPGNKQLLIPADEADHIIRQLALKGFSNSPRLFIIWQPELLNNASANRLLKSLEEPGQNTFFILVTHAPERVLQTISSRCVRITTHQNTDQEIERFVKDLGHSTDDVSKALVHAEGSIGKVLNHIERADETRELSERLVNWLRYLYSGNVRELTDWSEQTSRLYREQLKQFFSFTMHVFQQATETSNHAFNGVPFTHENFSVERFTPHISVHEMDKIIAIIESGYRDISRNGNGKIILLDTSLQLTKYIGKA